MLLVKKLYLFLPLLLSSRFGHALSAVDVQLFVRLDCPLDLNPHSQTLTEGAAPAPDNCYMTGLCVPAALPFRSFKVTRIAVQVDNAPKCFVFTYEDTACATLIQGVPSAGPLFYETKYPTPCVNQYTNYKDPPGTVDTPNVQLTPLEARSFKFVRGVSSR